MPRPSACRISVAAAICTATEMRCMTKGTNLRVAHVASRSNSACVSRLARCSAALRIRCRVLLGRVYCKVYVHSAYKIALL